MSEERFWNTDEYVSTAKFFVPEVAMTMRRAGRIFRLDPAPPKVADINDYIISAVRDNDLTHFTYFLHYYEPRLNKRVYRFLLNEGIDRHAPLRFLDYKLSCVLAMLECLPNYDPDKGADFLTYAHHFIGNALLDCRMHEEAGSFKSLDEYKAARGIAWLYNNSGNGRPCEDRIILKEFSKLREEAGLPKVVFHSLRHPYVKHTTKIFSLHLNFLQVQFLFLLTFTQKYL